jgi:hypothetical protein
MGYNLTLNSSEDESHVFSITYNVSKMFYHHNEFGIKALSGLDGEDGAEFLKGMINHFMENFKELEAMNPSNGWGSYENTLQCLVKMLIVSKTNPSAEWYVC